MPATPELWANLGQNNTSDGPSGIFIGDQNDPKVVHLSNGNILVGWVSNQTSGVGSPAGTDIIGRLYDPLGNAIGGEFLLNQGRQVDNERDFDLAATSGGGFAMVFIDADINDSAETDVRLMEFNNAGTVLSDVLVASDGSDDQTYRNPNIAVSGNNVLVSYESDNGNNQIDVFTKSYNLSTNTVGAEVEVASTSAGSGQGVSGSNVATLSNGGFVVVLGDRDPAPSDDDIFFQRYNADGTQAGGRIAATSGGDFNQDPHVIGLVGGGFVISWEIDSTDNSGNSGIRVQVFDNSGVAQTGLVSPQTTNAGNQSNSVVAALADGGFVVAWVDENTDDIHGRRFDAAGATVGNQFDIDTDIGPLAGSLDIEGMDDGRFVVTWTESVQTGTTGSPFFFPLYDTDIRSAIYDPRDDENSPNDYDGSIVIGTIGDDSIDVVNDDDEVYGWNGNDTFSFTNSVGHSNDIYDGGTGTDRILLTNASTQNFNQLNELLSIEEIEFEAGAGEVKTAIFAAEHFGGAGIASNALIDGNANGAGAADTLRILMGNDTNIDLSGLTFSGWQDSFDSIEIIGDSSNEVMFGTSRNDTIFGNGGIDRLDGGLGSDEMDGGLGSDVYYVDNVGDTIVGEVGFASGGGIDTVYSSIDFTFANGSNLEVLRLEGAADSGTGSDAPESIVGNVTLGDMLSGNGGSDTINGKGGSDIIDGGVGADTLVGEAGNDIFYYGSFSDSQAGASTRDFINGFIHGSDRIDLSDIDANPFNAGNQAFEFIGSAAFDADGFNSAGQVRYFTFGGGDFNIVEADWQGDGIADLQIFVNGTDFMTESDFIL